MNANPCRFCNNSQVNAFYQFGDNRDRISVFCTKCGAKGPVADSEEDAVRLWNEGI